MGKSKSESNQSMDPQIKGALMNVFQTGQGLSRTPYQSYNAATVAPMSPFQQQGMQATLDASRAGIGQDQMRQAIAAAQGVSGYQPSNVRSGYVRPQNRVQDVSGGMAGGQERVGASNIPTSFQGQDATVGNVNTNIGFDAVRSGTVNDPGRIQEQQQTSQDIGSLGLLGPGASARDGQQVQAPSAINVGRVNAGDVRGIDAVEVGAINPGTVTSNDVSGERVSAAQFKDANLNDYMNQYQTGVIDSALGDIERARQMQQNQNASSAVSAGAFGGDRAAILDAENNRSALEQSAKTASALRSQGFESAARLAEADLARRSDASRANQQMDMQGQLANQQSGLAASQANAQLGLQGQTEAARLGLQSGLSAQDANMQAALANQQAGLSASQSNAELGLRGGQANQQASLQAALANQQTSSSDADRALRGGQINQDASLQARQQDLSRMMSNQDSQQAFALANQAQNMSAQQANAQNSLSRQQMNQDSGLRAALANQQAQLTAGQAANQGLLQTQSLGANASQANQANQFARQQLGSQASQSNQQAQMQAALANQANSQRYGFQNQDAAMQAALANQQMGFNQNQQNIDRQFGNVDNRMRAQLANQNAGLQGAQQRLAGAGMLGQLGQDQRAMTFADAQQMQGVGNQQQQFAQQIMDDQYRRFQEQQNHPFRMFDVLRSGAGMLPNPTTTSQSSRSFNIG